MIDTTPKRGKEAWRGVPKAAQPWPDIVAYWADWETEIPRLGPLHQLVRALASSPASSVLFGSIMTLGEGTGIFVSDSPEFRSMDNTLEIRIVSGAGHFEFWHRTFSGHDDHKLCPAAEAIKTLRLFLRYKFGVLLEGPAA